MVEKGEGSGRSLTAAQRSAAYRELLRNQFEHEQERQAMLHSSDSDADPVVKHGYK